MRVLIACECSGTVREHAAGYSEKYRKDFKYGVVDAIRVKLKDQWEASKKAVRTEQVNPMALVRVNNAIVKMEQRLATVEKWMETNTKFRNSKSTYAPEVSARQHGFSAGQTIQINRAKAGVTGGVAGQLN